MKNILLAISILAITSGCAQYIGTSDNQDTVEATPAKPIQLDKWESIDRGLLMSPVIDSTAGSGKGQFEYIIKDHDIETKLVIFNGKVCNLGETDLIDSVLDIDGKFVNVKMKCERTNMLAIIPDHNANKFITNELIQNHPVKMCDYTFPAEGFIDGFSKAIGIPYQGELTS